MMIHVRCRQNYLVSEWFVDIVLRVHSTKATSRGLRIPLPLSIRPLTVNQWFRIFKGADAD